MPLNVYVVCIYIYTYIHTLQDGPNNIWDTLPIAFYLLPYIRRHDVRALVTFDGHGVSGVLQCVAVGCRVLLCDAACGPQMCAPLLPLMVIESLVHCIVLQRVAACCSLLQCVIMCCSVMRWVAVCCCSVL